MPKRRTKNTTVLGVRSAAPSLLGQVVTFLPNCLGLTEERRYELNDEYDAVVVEPPRPVHMTPGEVGLVTELRTFRAGVLVGGRLVWVPLSGIQQCTSS